MRPIKSLRHTIYGIALLFAVCSAALQAAPTAQPETSLTLGFFPIVSTVTLFKRFMPLADYLSAQLGVPIRLVTAKNFPTFVKRTAERAYDIVVTAPHFAVRAADSGQYTIRATTVNEVQQLIVVRKNSPLQNLEQLAGATIATPPGRALMTMMGKDFLAQAGLSGPRQPRYRAFTSHNAANQALLAGEVDAAIASSNVVSKAVQRGKPLRILAKGRKLPSMATLVASDLPAALADRVEQAFVGMANTEHGRQVLRQIGFPGYRAVSIADYEPVRAYAYRGQAKAAPQ